MTIRRGIPCLLVALSLSFPAAAQYIYVANSGEATVSEIDINQEREVARFRTWDGTGATQAFDQGSLNGAAPSRIVVDDDGSIYVLNRQWTTGTYPETLPSLIKIKPPGSVTGSTSSDADNNGAINLTDPNDSEVMKLKVVWQNPLLPFTTADPNLIGEKRIEWIVRIGDPAVDAGGLGRSLCMDQKGYLWVGLNTKGRYYQINPANGQKVATVNIPGHTPYGCVVDSLGALWSVESSSRVFKINTNNVTPDLTPKLHGNEGTNYAISIARDCDINSRIYLSDRTGGHTSIAVDRDPSATTLFTNPPLHHANGNPYPPFNSVSVAVDRDGNIISGKWSTTNSAQANLIKYTPAGLVLWDTDTAPGAGTAPGIDVHGLIVDKNNDGWAVYRGPAPYNTNGQVVKYLGANGQRKKIITVGREPYTYTNQPPPVCPCANITDRDIACRSLTNGTGTYAFNAGFTNENPFATAATDVEVAPRPPMTNLSTTVTPLPLPMHGQGTIGGTFTVQNGKPGDRVCFDIRLTGGPERDPWCCPKQEVCFTLPECRFCVEAQVTIKCRPDGTPYLDLQIHNGGPTASQSVQVFSTTPGVAITPTNSTVVIPANGTTNLQLGISGASFGQPISLTVNLHGPMNEGVYDWCCTTTITFVYPQVLCPLIDVWGEVYQDVNLNAKRDPREGALPGWTVLLQPEKGEARTALTDENGTFRFVGVAPGRYRVSLQLQPPLRTTEPRNGGYDITASPGTSTPLRFGVARPRLIDR
jgi:hypothetical protein